MTMHARVATFTTAILASIALSACGNKTSFSTPPPAHVVTITASGTTVLANGVNTVTIHVQDNLGGSIAVSTTRGTLPGGGTSTTVAGAGDVALTTCDSGVNVACAGTAVVTASVGGASSQVSIVFASLAACASDCNLDPACANHSCTATGGASGTCSAATPSICTPPACVPSPPGAATETSCGDNVDNDCNGQIDCADTACDNQPCKAGSPTFLCKAAACTDVSTGLAIAISAGRTRLPADGAAATPITATVTRNGLPAAGIALTFATDLGSLSAATATTGADGKASVTFTASLDAGAATVAASVAAVPLVSQSLVLTLPALGTIRLASAQYQIMGVRFSGFQETNQLTFEVLDTAGLAYPAGLAISFTHQPLGDSYVGTTASCVVGPPALCSASGVTDAAGRVVVLLTSGRVYGVVSVAASSTAGRLSADGVAGNLAIVGAKASGAHIALSCSPRNVPALTLDDCSNSFYSGSGSTVTCTASLADRFNNVLGVATLATFASEAGSMGPPSTTPAYDPAKPPTGQTSLGVAVDFLSVNGHALPRDVAPFAGEYSLQFVDTCGNLVHNPRDGLATIIVTANGEEGFVDLNGNGAYDPGEPFIDMGEPFIDENDNGQFDPGEYFVDVNNNQAYDGPNGVWDANTVIWAEARITYTGFAVGIAAGGNAGSRFFAAGSPPSPTAQPSFSVLGTATGPTTQSYGLFLTDRNFNQLNPATTYAVAPRGTGVVTAALALTPAVVDNLGMTFSQKYCDHPTAPTLCDSVCRTAPCYVVTNVGNCDLPTRATCLGFSYGNLGQVDIKGACSSAAAGDTVDATATLNGVVSRVSISGTCAP